MSHRPFRLVTLLGIRPDIIRLFKLIKLLDAGQRKYHYQHILAHTGQHFDYELDTVFYKQLGVRKPTVNLNVGRTLKERGGPAGFPYQLSLLVERIAEFLEKEKPDAVLYLGDTNSVLSSIVVARYGIPVIHIEGGGRSFDWRMPEEKNRIVIDHLASMTYCYLQRYREILLREGIPPYRVRPVGNLIVDAVQQFLPKAEKSSIMRQLKVKPKRYILVTLHREENTVKRTILTNKIKDLARLGNRLKLPVVFPVMPRVKNLITRFGLQRVIDNSRIIETRPLGFLEFLKLESNAMLIISDSGTVQEEALLLGRPCLITRLSTERPETIEAGATVLSNNRLYENALKALKLPTTWNRTILNPEGKSPSETIFKDLIQKIENQFFKRSRLYPMVGEDYVVQEAYGKTQ